MDHHSPPLKPPATGAHRSTRGATATSRLVNNSRTAPSASATKPTSYSPYARRTLPPSTSRQALQHDRDDDEEDLDEDVQFDDASPSSSPPVPKQQQQRGLFGTVKSLPGRALGYIFRSASSSTLNQSPSVQDLRRELVQQEQHSSTTSPRQTRSKATPATGGGMIRSKTSYNLSQVNGTPSTSSRRAVPVVAPSPFASSSSMSALSSLAQPRIPSSTIPRSSHSTLFLNPSNTTGTNGTNGARPHRSTRAASPALSATSSAAFQRNRSPSPTRNGLAGSMSAFNFNPSYTGGASPSTPGPPPLASAGFASSTSTNPFGLTSRSPFRTASSVHGGSGSQIGRSVSTNSHLGASGGHALFPYTSTVPRGTNHNGSSLVSSPSTGSLKRSAVGGSTPLSPGFGARSRVGSPLNPLYGGGGSSVGGLNEVERARKKQLVWHPERGLVSREALEREEAA